MEELRPQLWS
jgi:hypothetical protein